ncbi:MAG: toll/interleukin-1 receptor domain-containing protein [Sedimenticolaceae bacterium]
MKEPTYRLLQTAPEDWNEWRDEHPELQIDLAKADLSGQDLQGINLQNVRLDKARLVKANLSGNNLSGASLRRVNARKAVLNGTRLCGADLAMSNLLEADLAEADLYKADLRGARLTGANLASASLVRADLLGAQLHKANFTGALLSETVFADTTLNSVKGLDTCRHRGPSIMDLRTLQLSGNLPLVFLQGCGLPERVISQLSSIFDQAGQYYSCFISYAGRDEAFANHLHAELQKHGVRCWYAPEDMKIGAKILDSLDQAIKLNDKVLLVLSDNSLSSGWVEDEITKAFAEERKRSNSLVVIPIRIDDAVMHTEASWAVKLRDNRNIGDFSQWQNPTILAAKIQRLLRDLEITG